ncbi:chlorophyllase-2, chloroplastic-like [Papaver somniferum]|nr:chlorophyllase-2, chloroplastic-like [Papaver somniferum]
MGGVTLEVVAAPSSRPDEEVVAALVVIGGVTLKGILGRVAAAPALVIGGVTSKGMFLAPLVIELGINHVLSLFFHQKYFQIGKVHSVCSSSRSQKLYKNDIYNSFYSQLIQHIASHGFIVVAPQLYNCGGPDSSDEIKSAAAITEWLSDGLTSVLPPTVLPNLTKAALAGHSRGGKVAFALALSYSSTNKSASNGTNSTIKYSALMGIDPVDGMDKGKQTPPPVLTYVPQSFDLDMAVLVVGSGLGEIKRNRFFPPCAPKGVNHEDFYNECQAPACYLVVKDYGHTDMLDDETKGIRGKLSYCTCKNGKTREPMRQLVGGIMVAFMKAYLEDDPSYLNAIKGGKETRIPVDLQTVEFFM